MDWLLESKMESPKGKNPPKNAFRFEKLLIVKFHISGENYFKHRGDAGPPASPLILLTVRFSASIGWLHSDR